MHKGLRLYFRAVRTCQVLSLPPLTGITQSHELLVMFLLSRLLNSSSFLLQLINFLLDDELVLQALHIPFESISKLLTLKSEFILKEKLLLDLKLIFLNFLE